MDTQTARATAPTTDELGSLTVEDLAAMTVDEATETYRRGTVPESLAVLDGKPRGRMLATVGLDSGFVGARLRAFARSRLFPWDGKSFTSESDAGGRGVNRVRLLGLRSWFAFETRVAPSAIDGQPCILLDYEQPGNPWFIRKIHDELRQVGPNLFMGPAMWKTKADPKLILHFAIDTSA